MQRRQSPAILLSPVFLAHLSLGVVLGACGGGQVARGGAEPVVSTPTERLGDAGVQSAGPATTTLILGDGGELQGVKLSEVHPPASAEGPETPVAKGPHGREPGRAPADIRAIILGHRDAARACYDKGLSDHPGIEGNLVMQWTIDPKGNVTHVSSDPSRSQISEATIVECIGDVITKIQFAPSQGGFETKAFYPFDFRPHGGQQPKTQ